MGTRTTKRSLSQEEQLLADGRDLFGRAIRLITETNKLKVWVPLACSLVLTLYYLYTLHSKAATAGEHPQTAADSPTVAVPDAPHEPRVVATAPASVGASNDNNPSDIRQQAAQAHSAQQFDEEAKLWQQVLDGSSPQTACPQVGKAYELAGELDQSVEAFEKCIALDPQNSDTLIAYAHVLQAKGDFARASDLYRKCLAKDPRNGDAQSGLALLELRQNHLPEAENAAKKILDTSPQNTDALLVVGISEWRQGKLADAERIFLRGEVVDDRRADFHAFLGRIAEAQHRQQDALRQYERALQLDPNDSDIQQRHDRLQQSQ